MKTAILYSSFVVAISLLTLGTFFVARHYMDKHEKKEFRFVMTEEQARAKIAKMTFMEGASKNDPRSLEMVRIYGDAITHFGGGCKPTDGFSEEGLWKPRSDSAGKLVVIFPHSAIVRAAEVGGERLTTLSIGNGFRPTFRFSKEGGAYGSAPKLKADGFKTVTMKHGSLRQIFSLEKE